MDDTGTQGCRPNRSAPLDPARLTHRRILAGLKQQDLAERSGVSFQHISRLELGRVGASPEVLHKLAAALGCQVEALMPDEQAAS